MEHESLGLVDGTRDLIFLPDGRQLNTHGPSQCFGKYCCIHKPSDHPLVNAAMYWSTELGMMFRQCEHGQIHPDPDAFEYEQMRALLGLVPFYDGWHPCCPQQCCLRSAPADEPFMGGSTQTDL